MSKSKAADVDIELADLRGVGLAIEKREKELIALREERDELILAGRRQGWSVKALGDAGRCSIARVKQVLAQLGGGSMAGIRMRS